MLIELDCRNAVKREKPYKMSDKDGLVLLVHPNGSKYWRGRYRVGGKEKMLALGVYPEVSLSEARKAWLDARYLLRTGVDPLAKAKADLAASTPARTVATVTLEWYNVVRHGWAPRTDKNAVQRLTRHIYNAPIGRKPFSTVTPADIVRVLRDIEKTGAGEVAKRVGALLSRIGAYAVRCGDATANPAADLRDVLRPRVQGHFAAISHEGLPELLTAMRTNTVRMYPETLYGMWLLMLTMLRTNELIETPWAEFKRVDGKLDLSSGMWVIPASRMKSKRDHVVPLSTQTQRCLQSLYNLNGGGKWVFPNKHDPERFMSDGAILAAIKRMGYRGRMTGHGFRALGMSTIVECLGYDREVVDLQLAHGKKNKVQAAYDRAQFLPMRQKMMQDWADFIDAQQVL